MSATLKTSLRVSAVSSILILSLIGVSRAHESPGYYHGGGAIASNPRWLTSLRDNVLLSELSIPGTHDTMAFYGGDLAQTQSMSLPNQLQSGIRVLDIRCRNVRNRFPIYHGMVSQRVFFEEVLDMVVDFLKKNPGETVLMRVKEEHTPVQPTRPFPEVFRQVYWERYKDYMYEERQHHTNPTLGEMRGKIVILQDFPDPVYRYGLAYLSFSIQDNFRLRNNWALHDKWLAVRNHLNAAENGHRATKFMNYLSGAGGTGDSVFPYFVASGHSNPRTGAPRLSTGRTTIGRWRRSWPYFPRVSCAGSWCTIAFEGTNILTYERLVTVYKNRVGVIMSDFPGAGLINRTIELNNKFRQ